MMQQTTRSRRRFVGELSLLAEWADCLKVDDDQRKTIETIITLYSLDHPLEYIQGFFIARGLDLPDEVVIGCIENYRDYCESQNVGFGWDNPDSGLPNMARWLEWEAARRPIERMLVLEQHGLSGSGIERVFYEYGRTILAQEEQERGKIPDTVRRFFAGVTDEEKKREEVELVVSESKRMNFTPRCFRCGAVTGVVKNGTRKNNMGRGEMQLYKCTNCKGVYSVNKGLLELHQTCPQCNSSRRVFPDGDPVVTEVFCSQRFHCFKCGKTFTKTDYAKRKYPTEIREAAVGNVKSGLSTYEATRLMEGNAPETPSRQSVWKWTKESGHSIAPMFKRPMEAQCTLCHSKMYHNKDCPVYTHLRLTLMGREEDGDA